MIISTSTHLPSQNDATKGKTLMIKDQYSELQVETQTLWLHQYKGEILLTDISFLKDPH